MKHLFTALITNLHILLVSLLVVALSLGMIQATGGGNAATDSQKAHSSTILSATPPGDTSQHTTGDVGNDTTTLPLTSSGGGLYTTPAQPGNDDSPTTSTPASPPSYAPPTQTPPSTTCTPCADGTTNCADYCLPQQPVEPTPPSSGCGVCAGPIGIHQRVTERVMCPMYCMQTE